MDGPTCDEPIAGESTVHENTQERHQQACGLPAHDFCATCRYNVCLTHIQSRHDHHSRTHLPMVEEPVVLVSEERRSGDERRQG